MKNCFRETSSEKFIQFNWCGHWQSPKLISMCLHHNKNVFFRKTFPLSKFNFQMVEKPQIDFYHLHNCYEKSLSLVNWLIFYGWGKKRRRKTLTIWNWLFISGEKKSILIAVESKFNPYSGSSDTFPHWKMTFYLNVGSLLYS